MCCSVWGSRRREGDQLLHGHDLGHRRPEAVVNDRANVEPARLIEDENSLGDVARLVEGKPAATDLGQAVPDQAAVVAAQAVAALATDDQEHDPFARRLDLANSPPGLAQYRGVETAGETAIRSRDHQQMSFVLAGADEQR